MLSRGQEWSAVLSSCDMILFALGHTHTHAVFYVGLSS